MIYRFFQAASGVTSSYDALLDLFESLGNFLKRLEVYTAIQPTPIIMIDLITKIFIELLSVLALATKQINQGRFSKYTVRYMSVMLSVSQRNSRRICWGNGKAKYRLPSRDWTD